MWSLGVVVYEFVTLSKPKFVARTTAAAGSGAGYAFLGNIENALEEEVKDDVVRSILRHLLIKNPNYRLTAEEFYEVLDNEDGIKGIRINMRFKDLEMEVKGLKRELEAIKCNGNGNIAEVDNPYGYI